MSRPGRELEIIVSQIEEVLSGSILKVKSPDKVYDYNAKKDREVDVTIRGKFGSTNILVIIECRDRKGTEDITWIEELVTKQDSYHANKIIALSSGRFSKGAIELAKAKGIELRQIKTFKAEEVKTWMSNMHIEMVNNLFQIIGMDLQLDLPYGKQAPRKKMKPADNIFIIKKSGHKRSPNAIFFDFETQQRTSPFSLLERNKPPVEMNFRLHIDQKAPIQIRLGWKKYDVRVIYFRVLLAIRTRSILITEVKRYMAEEKLLGEMAIFKGLLDEKHELEMKVISEPKKEKGQRIAFSIKPVDDKGK
jgi:hypothetical protein